MDLLRASAVLAGLLACGACSAQAPVIAFRQDWCPDDIEVDAIMENFALQRQGCCITSAIPKYYNAGAPLDLLSPWRNKIVDQVSSDACTGSTSTWTSEDRARVAAMHDKKRAAAEAEQRNELANAAKQRREAEEQLQSTLSGLIADLPGFTDSEFCAAWGAIVQSGDAPSMAAARRLAAKRKLQIDESMTRRRSIKLGARECQVFASLGPPIKSNRSVGSWGVHVQHVFDRGYVYTKNGVVTSWQD